jgi:hypothetical protein
VFLGTADLKQMTGFTKRSLQVKWLTQNHIPFTLSGKGYPNVLRAYIEKAHGLEITNKNLMWMSLGESLMLVIVCGGRDFEDGAFINHTLDLFHKCRPIRTVIQGGARGADTWARTWAESRGVMWIQVDADWKEHGRKAGPIRNAEMLAYKPDMVIAFEGGRGTANMVKQALDAGVQVMRCTKEDTHGQTTQDEQGRPA